MDDQPDAPTPLEKLDAAVQEFVNSQVDQPTLVANAVVVWEQVRYDEDGDAERCISYAVPTVNFTLSGTLGLLEGVREYVRRDILGARPADSNGFNPVDDD